MIFIFVLQCLPVQHAQKKFVIVEVQRRDCMKNELNIFENEFETSGMSMLVCHDLNSKTTIITYLLHEYGILKGRETLFYTFERRCDYYYRHILSRISKIDKRLLAKYLYPWLGLSHYNTDMINRFYFVSAIEKIQQSNLFMIGETINPGEDYLDNMLSMLEFDTSTIIIIEDFDLLLERTKYSRKETIRKINEYAEKYEVHFVLICYKNSENKEFSKYYEISTTIEKEKKKTRILNINEYQNQKLQKKVVIEYNKNNYEIEKRIEK